MTEFKIEDPDSATVEIANATATCETAAGPALEAIDGKVAEETAGRCRGWGACRNPFTSLWKQPPDAEGNITLVLSHAEGNDSALGRFRVTVTTDPRSLAGAEDDRAAAGGG